LSGFPILSEKFGDDTWSDPKPFGELSL